MEVKETKEEDNKYSSFTLFGEPVIKTKCQRDALMTGITGGIVGGLVAFLFTSNPRKSTRLGVATYFVIGVTYACYCTYEEIQMKKQSRLLKQMLYETSRSDRANDAQSDDASVGMESA